MPSVESITKDLDTLGAIEQDEILNHLEEIIVLGSYAAEVTDEVKKIDFLRERSVLTATMMKCPETANTMVNKDIFASPAKGHSPTFQDHLVITARRT